MVNRIMSIVSERSGRRSRSLLPQGKPGELSKFGYHTNLSEAARHRALNKAIKAHGYRAVIGHLTLRRNQSKSRNPESAEVFREDQVWVSQKYQRTKTTSSKAVGPILVASSSRSRVLLPKLRKNLLTRYGYHNVQDMSESSRHAALRKAIKGEGYPKVIRQLVAVEVYGKGTSAGSIFAKDREWVSEQYRKYKETHGRQHRMSRTGVRSSIMSKVGAGMYDDGDNDYDGSDDENEDENENENEDEDDMEMTDSEPSYDETDDTEMADGDMEMTDSQPSYDDVEMTDSQQGDGDVEMTDAPTMSPYWEAPRERKRSREDKYTTRHKKTGEAKRQMTGRSLKSRKHRPDKRKRHGMSS